MLPCGSPWVVAVLSGRFTGAATVAAAAAVQVLTITPVATDLAVVSPTPSNSKVT